LFEHDLRANAFRICREGKPVSTFPDHALTERDAEPLFLAPHDVGMPAYLAAADAQRDLVGNACRARNLEAGADGGDVANDAIDSRAVELNGSGLEYALPQECASLMHSIDLRQKV
jgi:hypothetical protein